MTERAATMNSIMRMNTMQNQLKLVEDDLSWIDWIKVTQSSFGQSQRIRKLQLVRGLVILKNEAILDG
jgi:hypothetical protein